MERVIGIGAEALLVRKKDELIKKRIRKGYRYHELDEKLRKQRTRKEAKLLEKASGLVNTPKVMKSDEKTKEIVMEFIDGKKLSNCLDGFKIGKALQICKEIGEGIASLHDASIIHGDLTTSNMILHAKKIFFIDFGLGFESSKIEDKAVDLHLLKQAFESKHYERGQDYFNAALQGYKKSANHQTVMHQLKKVEARGRYKGKH